MGAGTLAAALPRAARPRAAAAALSSFSSQSARCTALLHSSMHWGIGTKPGGSSGGERPEEMASSLMEALPGDVLSRQNAAAAASVWGKYGPVYEKYLGIALKSSPATSDSELRKKLVAALEPGRLSRNALFPGLRQLVRAAVQPGADSDVISAALAGLSAGEEKGAQLTQALQPLLAAAAWQALQPFGEAGRLGSLVPKEMQAAATAEVQRCLGGLTTIGTLESASWGKDDLKFLLDKCPGLSDNPCVKKLQLFLDNCSEFDRAGDSLPGFDRDRLDPKVPLCFRKKHIFELLGAHAYMLFVKRHVLEAAEELRIYAPKMYYLAPSLSTAMDNCASVLDIMYAAARLHQARKAAAWGVTTWDHQGGPVFASDFLAPMAPALMRLLEWRETAHTSAVHEYAGDDAVCSMRLEQLAAWAVREGARLERMEADLAEQGATIAELSKQLVAITEQNKHLIALCEQVYNDKQAAPTGENIERAFGRQLQVGDAASQP